ncbi:transporter [Methylobacterium sp. JK268]
MSMKWIVAAGLAAAVTGSVTAAQAASVTQPGEQVGLAGGYPLPEGVYAINTFDYGRADRANAPGIGVNIPILVWSTPWTILGAKIEPLIAVPSVFVNPNNPAPIPNNDLSVFYNPIIGSVFAWDLGRGFGVSYLLGAYINVGDRGSLGIGPAGTPLIPQIASTTLRQTWTASFVGDGSYNITAALTYGLTLDPHARFGGAVGTALGPQAQSDSLNLDLTATKKFGKFEIGPVAYASTDLPVRRTDPLYRNYQRVGQVAVGGLVGYNFDRFVVQAYVTRDVVARETQNVFGQRQKNEETRGWFRIILPLYVADAAKPVAPPPGPLVTKY